MTPATPPNPGPIRNTRAMMRSTLMPIRRAAPWSMAAARMAVPVRVRLMNQYRASISSTEAAIRIMRMAGMPMPNRCRMAEGRMASGYTRYCAPQINITAFWKKMEAPRADTTADRRLALRRGR